ncbi:unnamed protein product [Rangifer tarandus platyrhynchus]|uniref:Uncharacterized protein n=2 Tax=Rangifer tarandus platyrhynchus TaxID=3082113 RepID=A0AC59Z6H1_RANTA|nr:unnamed protein product [Rangifer tarandus platyrhynchus]
MIFCNNPPWMCGFRCVDPAFCRPLCAGVGALEGLSRGRGGRREGRRHTGPAARHGRAPSVPAGQRPPSLGPGRQQLFCTKAIGGACRASLWRRASATGEGPRQPPRTGRPFKEAPHACWECDAGRPLGVCGEAQDDSHSGGGSSELQGSCRLPGCRACWVRGSWAGAGRTGAPQARGGLPLRAVTGAESAWCWPWRRAEPGGRPARGCTQVEGSWVLARLASEASKALGLARDLGTDVPSHSAHFQQQAPPALSLS